MAMGRNRKSIPRWNGARRAICLFLINHVFVGTRPFACKMKRKLLGCIGWTVGDGTTVVGPVECSASVTVGKDCWIGKNFRVNGNGTVIIGDRCDIGPEVTFQTGGHAIGDGTQRAGEGKCYRQTVGNGTWICGGSMICNDTDIGSGCVVAARACVVYSVPDNAMVGGVPAKLIKYLEQGSPQSPCNTAEKVV